MTTVQLTSATFEYTPGDPPGLRSGAARLGPGLGAKATGATLYELPPGQAICPYHFEYGEEEWVLVLAGHPTLRTPEGETRLEPLELAFFPPGPAGAHEVRNDTEETVRVLMFSDNRHPAITSYPDSGKVGVWTGIEAENLMVERRHDVAYFHGEPSRGEDDGAAG